jgi:hypothetical protein
MPKAFEERVFSTPSSLLCWRLKFSLLPKKSRRLMPPRFLKYLFSFYASLRSFTLHGLVSLFEKHKGPEGKGNTSHVLCIG